VLAESSVALNQQQKDTAEKNRIKAKILLTGKQTSGLVTAMGLSWFSALEAEFSKPYFIKVIFTYLLLSAGHNLTFWFGLKSAVSV